MSTFCLALLLYAGGAVAGAASNAATASAAPPLLREAVYDLLELHSGSPRPQVEVLDGLLPNTTGLRVRNIEGVTGAVLVKSRIIDKSEAENGRGAHGKSLFRNSVPQDGIRAHRGKPAFPRRVSLADNQTKILLTFLQPVKDNGKNNFLNRTSTKPPSLMKIIAGESDLQVEYLKTEDTAPLTLFRDAGTKKKFQNSLESSLPKLKIPGRVPPPSEKLASSQVTENEMGNDWSESKLNEDGLPDIVGSDLIKVKGQPPPQDDPDLIHLSQTLEEVITVTRTLPSVIETVTNTVTEITTQPDRRPISEVITQVLTITSVTVTTTTKTETSIVPATSTTAVDTMTMPPMQRPTKGTFLSPMPSRTSSRATSSTSIRPTSVVEPSTETSLLDPTDPDFSLPTNLRDRGTDLDKPNDEQMPDSSEHDVNVQANITQIMMLKDQAQNGGSVNQTKVLLFTMLKNMTNMTDTRLEALNEILKTPEDITFFLQTLVRRISEITNQTREMNKTNDNEDGDFAPVIRNSEDDPAEESIIPQDAVNTNVDVWPRGRGSNKKFDMAKFTPTIADPFHCRKKGVEYPITIDYKELRERIDTGAIFLIDVRNSTELEETGRLPWSYNLPLHDLYQAFKLQSSSFQTKFGFPKPKASSPIVTLTGAADGRVVEAWNDLQKFGYCNVKLYLGSYLDFMENGGNLVPFFRPSEDEPNTNASDLDNGQTASSQRNFRFSSGALEDEDKQMEVLEQTLAASSATSVNVDEHVAPKQRAPLSGRELRNGRTLSSWDKEGEPNVEDEEGELGANNMTNKVESDPNFQEKMQNENMGISVLNSSNVTLSIDAFEDGFKNDTQRSGVTTDVPSLMRDSNTTTTMTSQVKNESKSINEISTTDTHSDNPPTIVEDSQEIRAQSNEDGSRASGQRRGEDGTNLSTDEGTNLSTDEGTNLTTDEGTNLTTDESTNLSTDEGTQLDSVWTRTNAHQQIPATKTTNADNDRS